MRFDLMKRRMAPLVVLACATAVAGQTASTTRPDDRPTSVRTRAPSGPEEIAQARAAVARQMEALRPTTRPAATLTSQAATQPEGVFLTRATELWQASVEYDKVLEQQDALYARIAEFKSEAHLARFNEEIAELRRKTDQINRRLSGSLAYVTSEEYRQMRELLSTLSRQHDALVKADTGRAQILAGYAQRRKDAAAEVAAMQKRLDGIPAQPPIPAGGRAAQPVRDVRQIERQLAERQLETAVAKAAILELEESILILQQPQEQKRIQALADYVRSQQTLVNRLGRARTTDVREQIEAELSRAKTPYEKTYLEASKALLASYEQLKGYEEATRERYPEVLLGRQQKRIARRDSYWQVFLEALPRRQGSEIQAKLHEIRKELNQETRELNQRRADLYLSLEERQTVHTKRDEITLLIDDYREKLAQEVRASDDGQAGKYSALFEERRQKWTGWIDGFIALQDDLINRLKTAERELDEYCKKLERYRSRLYWAYLVVRDQGLLSASWGKIRTEWSDGGRTIRAALQNAFQQDREQLRGVAAYRWALALSLLVLMVLLGWLGRRRLDAVAQRLTGELSEQIEREGIEMAGINVRMKLAVLHLLAETAGLCWPLAALLISLVILGVAGAAFPMLSSLILFIICVRLAFGIVNGLFMVTRPRFRVIRCSNKVAGYYRRWLRALLWLVVVAAPLPLFLALLDIMPATRIYAWHLLSSAGLAVLLVFFLRRRLVLKVVGREDEVQAHGLRLLITWCYPLIPMGIVGLLVLEFLGYGALTTYIVGRTCLTIAVILATVVLLHYVTDYTRLYQKRLKYRWADKASDTEPAEDLRHTKSVEADRGEIPREPDGTGQAGDFVALVALVIGCGIRVVGIIIILNIWGITFVEIQDAMAFQLAGSAERPLTLWRLLAAMLVIVGTLLFSRSLRSVLQTKVYPEYRQLDVGARAAINTILHYVLIVVGAYWAMQLLHLDLSAVTVLMGTVGLGLGLGLQPLFINFVSGLIILFERHINVGDIVEVGDKMGEVTQISMRSTSIKTFDNVLMVIPNSEFISSKAVNWSLQDPRIRGQIDVGVAYGSDIGLVRQLLLRAAAEHPRVLKNPEPVVWFTDFGDNALTFRLLVWFENISHRMAALTDLRFAITRLFEENHITIPYPQRTISLEGGKPLPIEIVGPSRQDGREPGKAT